MVSTPPPPDPFDAETEILTAGTLLYRVGSIRRAITAFNPGQGAPTRFAFFGAPPVPVLYAADTDRAAVAELLLHDVPITGGYLHGDAYSCVVMGRLRITEDLRLASLRGLGLRRLGVEARHITETDSTEYPRTVLWARAAHDAGYAGLAWTSGRCSDSRAVVLFGDRAAYAVALDPTFGRYFDAGPGLDWLIDTCAPLRVDVLPPS